MSDVAKFTVCRAHWGDKAVDGEVIRHRYEKGDAREADAEDVHIQELVKRKVIKSAGTKGEAKSGTEKV